MGRRVVSRTWSRKEKPSHAELVRKLGKVHREHSSVCSVVQLCDLCLSFLVLINLDLLFCKYACPKDRVNGWNVNNLTKVGFIFFSFSLKSTNLGNFQKFNRDLPIISNQVYDICQKKRKENKLMIHIIELLLCNSSWLVRRSV